MLDSNFDALSKALNNLHHNPEIVKKIPPEERKHLMTALHALQMGYQDRIQQKDIDNTIKILKAYSENEVPKTSWIKGIKKGIENKLLNRVASAKLLQQIKETEIDLFFNRGDRFYLRDDQRKNVPEAFKAYKAAFDLGSTRAGTRLAHLIESNEFPKSELQPLLEQLKTSNPTIFNMNHLSKPQKATYLLYDKAAIKGDSLAQRKLGELWASHPDQENYNLPGYSPYDKIALRWLKKAAKQGDVQAQRQIEMIQSKQRNLPPTL